MTKPVILTVDDEPEVLNAVERDLRKHYAADYRILKAGSGALALEAVEQLKKRNAPVALFLVDARMPQMSGTEFLVQARRLYPEARKVLLTAYADTDVAIAGINLVQLDHYLMKPWDPPVREAVPRAGRAAGRLVGILPPPVRGHPRCRFPVVPEEPRREGLPVPQPDAIPVDRCGWRCGRQGAGGGAEPGLRHSPVVFFPDGTALVEPGAREIAEKIGLPTTATRPFYDLLIVGGGPTGLAAAVYPGSEGVRTVLLERETTRPGRHERAHRELPRLSQRVDRCGPGAPGNGAGAALRRRGAHRARGEGHPRRRPVPHCDAGGRHRAFQLRAAPGVRDACAAAGCARRGKAQRRRGVLRRRPHRGGRLRAEGCAGCRGGQLGARRRR